MLIGESVVLNKGDSAAHVKRADMVDACQLVCGAYQIVRVVHWCTSLQHKFIYYKDDRPNPKKRVFLFESEICWQCWNWFMSHKCERGIFFVELILFLYLYVLLA